MAASGLISRWRPPLPNSSRPLQHCAWLAWRDVHAGVGVQARHRRHCMQGMVRYVTTILMLAACFGCLIRCCDMAGTLQKDNRSVNAASCASLRMLKFSALHVVNVYHDTAVHCTEFDKWCYCVQLAELGWCAHLGIDEGAQQEQGKASKL